MPGNPDIDPRLVDLVGAVPFWETLGIRLDDAQVGWVRLRLAMREGLRTFGERRVLHGGVIATLIDSAAASATRTLRGEDEPPVARPRDDRHARQLPRRRDRRRSRPPRRACCAPGGRVAFLDVEVRDDDGELVARGMVTLQIRRAD